mmetsp:Transcript_110221/g.218976  ORF Transcript_110221/g.218976 Transcript_110221/m.218976 type:complete len:89 (-) Transcript_110221:2462-2728(-)
MLSGLSLVAIGVTIDSHDNLPNAIRYLHATGMCRIFPGLQGCLCVQMAVAASSGVTLAAASFGGAPAFSRHREKTPLERSIDDLAKQV